MSKENCAIIVAAGKGTRMGIKINKQFLNIKDKPILYYTLKSFSLCEEIDSIVLVVSAEDIDYVKKMIIEKYGFNKVKKIVEGGSERQHSVYNGLKAIENCNVVLIHDGARPFVSKNIILNGIKYANAYGASACGMKPKDTIKLIDENGFSLNTLNREELLAIQTPQSFKYEMILECHEKLKSEGRMVTDDTMVAERYGNKVYLYEGDYTNIKITTPEDMLFAEGILNSLE